MLLATKPVISPNKPLAASPHEQTSHAAVPLGRTRSVPDDFSNHPFEAACETAFPVSVPGIAFE